MGFYLIIALFFLVPCLLQLLLLRLTRRRLKVLRWLLLLAIPLLLIDAWIASNDPGLFFSFSALAAIFDLVLAGCVLLGWGLAWGIFALWNRRKETHV